MRMKRLKSLGSLCVALAWVFSGNLGAAEIASGPMLGVAALRETQVWFQADGPARAHAEFWPSDLPQQRRRSQVVTLDQAGDFSAKIRFTGLQPGTEYTYRLVLKDSKRVVSPPFHLRTQPLWQWRSDPPEFSVVFGSCAYSNEAAYDRPGTSYGGNTQIFSAMARAKPDLVLWLGDNLYFREADFSPWGMADRYRKTRAVPELQTLLRTGQHAAIWDDHDYGPNDANHSFIHKGAALELFKRNWPNPSFGLPSTPGIFTVVRFGDADFFMLDDRYYRDADNMPEDAQKTMLGQEQLRWLQNALLNSSATFKLIVNGSQIFGDHNRYEGWSNFRRERDGFVAWLTQAKLDGVMFLSGDRHHTEMFKVPRAGGYPLYEVTCSPLTAGTHPVEEEKNAPNLLPETLVGERNFCRIGFSGARGNRSISLSSHDVAGKRLWRFELGEKDLKMNRAQP